MLSHFSYTWHAISKPTICWPLTQGILLQHHVHLPPSCHTAYGDPKFYKNSLLGSLVCTVHKGYHWSKSSPFFEQKCSQTGQKQPVGSACKWKGKHNSVEHKMSPKMACLGSHSHVYYNACLLEIWLLLNPPLAPYSLQEKINSWG